MQPGSTMTMKQKIVRLLWEAPAGCPSSYTYVFPWQGQPTVEQYSDSGNTSAGEWVFC